MGAPDDHIQETGRSGRDDLQLNVVNNQQKEALILKSEAMLKIVTCMES